MGHIFFLSFFCCARDYGISHEVADHSSVASLNIAAFNPATISHLQSNRKAPRGEILFGLLWISGRCDSGGSERAELLWEDSYVQRFESVYGFNPEQVQLNEWQWKEETCLVLPRPVHWNRSGHNRS